MTTTRSTYTVEVLQQYRNDIATNGVSSAINVYTTLNNTGYGYAGWAKGVEPSWFYRRQVCLSQAA